MKQKALLWAHEKELFRLFMKLSSLILGIFYHYTVGTHFNVLQTLTIREYYIRSINQTRIFSLRSLCFFQEYLACIFGITMGWYLAALEHWISHQEHF